MRLIYNETSPYARKVRVFAAETGLAERIELIKANPFADDRTLLEANPLSKVPALVLDDGTALCDSPVILDYLDARHGGAPRIPPDGPARWQMLQAAAFADGLMDAAFAVVLERRRPEEVRHAPWIERQKRAIARTLDRLEGAPGPWRSEVAGVAQIGLACALGYLDFRLAETEWRTGRLRLAAWYEAFAARPAMRATDPAG